MSSARGDARARATAGARAPETGGGPAIRKRLLQVNGRRVIYRDAGAGAPVIVASGLGLSGRFYDRNLPAFAAAGLRLIVPDLPGFGGSQGSRTGLSVDDTAAFLLAFADALGIERAVWVGHSIGAQPAIALAAAMPARARGLVLVGPTGEPGSARLHRQAWALAREAWRAPPRVVARVLSDYVRTSPLAYVGTWLRYARDHPQRDLARIPCPTLVVVGTRDPVVSIEYVELLLHRLPRGSLQWIPGGTHALPRGSAAEFNHAVIGFCRSLDA